VDKMSENRLRWFRHVMRRKESEAIRTVMKMNIKGRGRPIKKWVNTIKEDMRTAGVCMEDVGDWANGGLGRFGQPK